MLSTLTLGSGISNESGHDDGKSIDEAKQSSAETREEQSLWHYRIIDAKGLSGVSTAAEAALVLVHTWCFTWCRNTADHS